MRINLILDNISLQFLGSRRKCEQHEKNEIRTNELEIKLNE